MRSDSCTILTGADTGSVNGLQIDSNQLVAASFQATFGDDTVDGTLTIQASNDVYNAGYLPQDFLVTNWTNIPSATATVTSGASVIIDIPQMCYRWIRAVFTYASGGSTTVTVNMYAQGV